MKPVLLAEPPLPTPHLKLPLLLLLLLPSTRPSTAPSCRYPTPGGNYVDLAPLASQNGTARFRATQGGEYEYLWSPCLPFSAAQVCLHAAVCQRVVPIDFYVLLAGQDAAVEKQGGQLVLAYTGTDPTDLLTRYTYIVLQCDPDQVPGEFIFQEENPPRQYHFRLSSKFACERAGPTPPVTSPPTTTSPSPSPTPPVNSLVVITLLLGCILVSVCVLNCMVFLGLVTRRRRRVADSSKRVSHVREHINMAFDKKPA